MIFGSNQKLLMGTAGYIPPDPDFANVSLLLHGDGTDGSTTFTDSSSNAFTVTGNGGVEIDTAITKFGSGSIQFGGVDGYLSVADDAALDLTGDFTIECWVYVASDATLPRPLAIKRSGVASSPYLLTIRGSTPNSLNASFSGTTDGVSWQINGTFTGGTETFSVETWTHIAAVKNGTTVDVYVNGVSGLTLTSVPTLFSNSEALHIGSSDSGSTGIKAHIDEYRITKGVARYTANFTPPTRAFPDR
jgi:hypothetical protein